MTRAAKMALQRITQEISALDVDDQVRRRFKKLVADACLAHGVTGIDRSERVYYARRMLDAGISRTTARDRLIARFNISRRQAYRALNDALQLCQKEREIGTLDADNQIVTLSPRSNHASRT